MNGELFINEKDAYTTWGISMDNTSLSALMTPAPIKELIESNSRLQNGKQVTLANIRVADRSLTLQINLTANSEDEFFSRYSSFCEELETGVLNIRTKYQPNVVYRTIYVSCSQFSQFMRGIGKFSIKLNEPNPKDRNLN